MTESQPTSSNETIWSKAINAARSLYDRMNTADDLDTLGESIEKAAPEFKLMDGCVSDAKEAQKEGSSDMKALMGLQSFIRPIVTSNKVATEIPEELTTTLNEILTYCESITINKLESDSELQDFNFNDVDQQLNSNHAQMNTSDDLDISTQLFRDSTPLLKIVDKKFESLAKMASTNFDLKNLIISLQHIIKSILLTEDTLNHINPDIISSLQFVRDYQLTDTNQQL